MRSLIFFILFLSVWIATTPLIEESNSAIVVDEDESIDSFEVHPELRWNLDYGTCDSYVDNGYFVTHNYVAADDTVRTGTRALKSPDKLEIGCELPLVEADIEYFRDILNDERDFVEDTENVIPSIGVTQYKIGSGWGDYGTSYLSSEAIVFEPDSWSGYGYVRWDSLSIDTNTFSTIAFRARSNYNNDVQFLLRDADGHESPLQTLTTSYQVFSFTAVQTYWSGTETRIQLKLVEQDGSNFEGNEEFWFDYIRCYCEIEEYNAENFGFGLSHDDTEYLELSFIHYSDTTTYLYAYMKNGDTNEAIYNVALGSLGTSYIVTKIAFDGSRSSIRVKVYAEGEELVEFDQYDFTYTVDHPTLFGISYFDFYWNYYGSTDYTYTYYASIDYIKADYASHKWTQTADATDPDWEVELWDQSYLGSDDDGIINDTATFRLVVPKLDAVSFTMYLQAFGSTFDDGVYRVYFTITNVKKTTGEEELVYKFYFDRWADPYQQGLTVLIPDVYSDQVHTDVLTNASIDFSASTYNNRKELSTMLSYQPDINSNETILSGRNVSLSAFTSDYSDEFVLRFEVDADFDNPKCDLHHLIVNFDFIAKDIFSDMGNIVNSVLNLAGEIVSGLTTILGAIANFIVSALRGIIEFFASFIVIAFNLAIDSLGSLLTGALDTLGTLITSALEALTQLVDDLMSVVEDIFDALGDVVALLTTLADGIIQAFLSAIADIIEEVLVALNTLITEFTEWLINLFESLLDAVGLTAVLNNGLATIALFISFLGDVLASLITLVDFVTDLYMQISTYLIPLFWLILLFSSVKDDVFESIASCVSKLNADLPNVSILGTSIGLKLYMIVIPITVVWITSI